jgi:deferrochelatase/peroxidase EfeB
VSVDLNQTYIDPQDPTYQALLEDLQGNILKGHERNYSAHIFVNFKSDHEATRKWISHFGKKIVTSAKNQSEHSAKYKQSEGTELGGLFCGFLLSYKG